MSSITELFDLLALHRVIDTYCLTVSPDTLVSDAITLMLNITYVNEEKANCVLVTEECRLIGIFTQVDALRLAISGKNVSSIKVAEVMESKVISLKKSPNQDIFTALRVMGQHKISYLPIVDEKDNLLGIVEEKSLLQFFVDENDSIIQRLQKQIELERQITELEYANADCQQEIKDISAAEAQIKFDANILANVGDAVIAIDNEDKIIYLNKRAEQQYNINGAEFIRRSLEEVYKYRWLNLQDKLLAKESLSLHGWWQGENIHIKNNGEEIYVELSVSFLNNNRGEKIGLLAVIRDITQRKQAEEKLRQTEALLQEAQRIARIGSWSWDLTTDETWWSKEFYRFTNSKQGNSTPNIETISQFIYSADRERVFQLTKDAIEQGIPYETEFRFIHSDGTVGYAFSCGKIERDAKGKIVRFYGISKDISEYKQVEQALRESEERYRNLAQKLHSITSNAPIYIYEIDSDGKIIFANRGYECVSQKEVLGSSLSDWFSHEQLSTINSVLQEVFSNEQVQNIEYVIPDSLGEIRFYQTKIAPIKNGKEVTSAVLIARDITEEKQAEDKISQQAALLDVTTDAILLRSLEAEILYCNKSAEKMYGWTAQEALGKGANELLYKEVTQELTEALQEVTRNGSWQGELKKVTKQGREITVASRWTLVRDETGNPKSILSVDTDITEKKQLENQFLRAQRLESLGTLASGIAHDLNNMLTPILAIAQLLRLKVRNIDESSQEMLVMLEANAKRGAKLVKQVLSFARGDEGKRTVLQVKHLLKDIEQFAKGTFPKSITIESNLVRDLWTVSGDVTQLHQVFMNLVVNARDAMFDGGTLTIEADNKFVDESYAKMNIEAKVGSYVVVTIADTGIGISPKIIDRIFDPFFTTKEVGEGTGLGLSTVLAIVKNHGGFIEVSSEIAKGTQFKVYLSSIQESSCAMSEKKQLPRGNGELILVVDDEVGICEIIKATLETYNFHVITAKDGIEAIAVYVQQKNEINIVLMDMMMPSMDGATAIRTLQQMNPLVKIIAMSGLVTSEALAQSSGTTIQGFLAKPFSASELLNALQRVIS